MKRLILFGLLTLLTCVFTGHSAAAQGADTILGKWQDAAHPEKQVEFHKKDSQYTGKVINDPKNPSRNNAILFRELVWNNTNKTYQGTLINPDNKDEYKVEISLPDNNTFQFKAGKFIFSRTFIFKRI
ncbi:DUF2147 domain-containing protein [Rhodocytophaga aerolata]|uniref:DUF2147 domain-containing protein n=1 Tax=Rhodocytophaga aerolata TaxID=455078 RepID=A0ABT8RB82_9BACT|nr:DUF2147 domain-containing protein [Rhodocytophaga aerolata]MDO1449371.1 DUF2147 domain-containing protein [Rhodocytophaga aerolata]